MQQPTSHTHCPLEPWLTVLLGAATILALLALGGYAFNWRWTGFPGNTLWDWMNLLLLPIVLTTVSVWFSKRPKWSQMHSAIAIGGGVLFLILIVGGYMLNWTWTGFQGNTLWDWLHLLILPALLSVLSIQLGGFWQQAQKAEEHLEPTPQKRESATEAVK